MALLFEIKDCPSHPIAIRHTPAAVKSAWESLTKTVDWRKGFTHKDLAAVLMPDVECCTSVQTNVCEQLMRTPLYCRHFMEVMQNQVRSQHRWRLSKRWRRR